MQYGRAGWKNKFVFLLVGLRPNQVLLILLSSSLLFLENNSSSCFTSCYDTALSTSQEKIEETQTYCLGKGQFLISITFRVWLWKTTSKMSKLVISSLLLLLC